MTAYYLSYLSQNAVQFDIAKNRLLATQPKIQYENWVMFLMKIEVPRSFAEA